MCLIELMRFLAQNMIIGYARVSTQDQSLDLQLDALKVAKCQQVFQEKISSAKERQQLLKMLEMLREGDTVVVYKLDRLGRSLKELVELITEFQERKVEFISLQDAIDTSTAQGRLFLNLFASLAEFERDIIRERTKAGLAAARARGRVGGKKKGLTPEAIKKAETAVMLYKEKKSAEEIAGIIGVARATVYRYLENMGQKRNL